MSLLSIKYYNLGDRRSKGGVLVETLLLLPILIALFVGLYSLISLIRVYMSLNQIAREAVLPAAIIDDIDECKDDIACKDDIDKCQCTQRITSFPEGLGNDFDSCIASGKPTEGSAEAYRCGHIITQWNIARLLESYELPIDIDNISITSKYDKGNMLFNTEISAHIEDGISLFNGLSLQASASSDYS